MMSQRSKREMIEAIRPRYLKANKAGKKQILNEFVATTGYHRKYAIRVLKHGPKPKGLKSRVVERNTRAKWYKFWNKFGKFMAEFVQKDYTPFLPECIRILERCQEISLAPEVKQLLLNMSRSTIDRCLKPVRFKGKLHGLSTTKPGTLLKKMIPVRTFADWNEVEPGFMEIVW